MATTARAKDLLAPRTIGHVLRDNIAFFCFDVLPDKLAAVFAYSAAVGLGCFDMGKRIELGSGDRNCGRWFNTNGDLSQIRRWRFLWKVSLL